MALALRAQLHRLCCLIGAHADSLQLCALSITVCPLNCTSPEPHSGYLTPHAFFQQQLHQIFLRYFFGIELDSLKQYINYVIISPSLKDKD